VPTSREHLWHWNYSLSIPVASSCGLLCVVEVIRLFACFHLDSPNCRRALVMHYGKEGVDSLLTTILLVLHRREFVGANRFCTNLLSLEKKMALAE
jgi:hypothetical protein